MYLIMKMADIIPQYNGQGFFKQNKCLCVLSIFASISIFFFIRLAEVRTNSSATVYVSASNKKGQFLDVNALKVNSTLSTSV